MKILITGAGIGGLALASFLRDSDFEINIIEKQKNWQHQGYSFGLWSNGRHMLQKLGLSDRFDKQCVPMRNLYICDGKGRRLRSYRLDSFYRDFGLGYAHVQRADVHDWLLQIAGGQEKIKMNCYITSLQQHKNKVHVKLNDNTEENFDLVVGADGVHSHVRDLCFKSHIEKYENWRVWWAWVDRKYATQFAVTEYVEPGEHVVIFDEGDKALAVMFAHADHNSWDNEEGRIDRLKQIFKNAAPDIAKALHGQQPENVVPTDLATVTLAKWHEERIVLLGDAAHGFEPFAGLGASMALEDAYVLASRLLQEKEISVALAIYENIRKQRVEQARVITKKMKLWALVDSPMLRSFINSITKYIPSSLFERDFRALMSKEI
jgi:2-polyprenyl-6-methoxyphenol hydroxylase-like FAD-dependent oxidoreductase